MGRTSRTETAGTETNRDGFACACLAGASATIALAMNTNAAATTVPDECWAMIASELPLITRMALSRTCTRFRQYLRYNPGLWTCIDICGRGFLEGVFVPAFFYSMQMPLHVIFRIEEMGKTSMDNVVLAAMLDVLVAKLTLHSTRVNSLLIEAPAEYVVGLTKGCMPSSTFVALRSLVVRGVDDEEQPDTTPPTFSACPVLEELVWPHWFGEVGPLAMFPLLSSLECSMGRYTHVLRRLIIAGYTLRSAAFHTSGKGWRYRPNLLEHDDIVNAVRDSHITDLTFYGCVETMVCTHFKGTHGRLYSPLTHEVL